MSLNTPTLIVAESEVEIAVTLFNERVLVEPASPEPIEIHADAVGVAGPPGGVGPPGPPGPPGHEIELPDLALIFENRLV